MPSLAIDDSAQQIVARLEKKQAARDGSSLAVARRRLASRLDIAPGTLENIRRGRIKGVRGWIMGRLHEALVREIQSEITALNHELEILRHRHTTVNFGQITEVEASLRALHATMKDMRS